MQLQLDAELKRLLAEGAKQTGRSEEELIAITLRKYLRQVIEELEWDEIEAAAVRACQMRPPSMDD